MVERQRIQYPKSSFHSCAHLGLFGGSTRTSNRHIDRTVIQTDDYPHGKSCVIVVGAALEEWSLLVMLWNASIKVMQV